MHLNPSTSTRPAALPGQPTDAQFADFVVACSASGGLARGDELAQQMRERGCGDFASLARQIVARQVFSVRWHDDFWVPMFQFDVEGALAVKPALADVLAALGATFDGPGLAAWFTRPNRHLGGATPARRLDHDLAGVLQAAHAAGVASRTLAAEECTS